MDLRQMEVVVAVAEEGGFTAAARRLHVVQSAVSGTVRELEKELGIRLFDRTTHRVSLTAAREEMVRAAAPARSFARPDEVTFAETADLPFVDFTPGWAVRQAVDRAYRSAGVERGAVFEVNDIVAASELVRHDLGVCVMPQS